jgi:hypothetical protein
MKVAIIFYALAVLLLLFTVGMETGRIVLR